MFIQVRSLPLSHEWEVMVEPSMEASLPTRMLVQSSDSVIRSRVVSGSDSETDNKSNTIAIGKQRRMTRLGCICIFIFALLPAKGVIDLQLR
jgi:hypothetical protein